VKPWVFDNEVFETFAAGLSYVSFLYLVYLYLPSGKDRKFLSLSLSLSGILFSKGEVEVGCVWMIL
jgi:hypothetical protein